MMIGDIGRKFEGTSPKLSWHMASQDKQPPGVL